MLGVLLTNSLKKIYIAFGDLESLDYIAKREKEHYLCMECQEQESCVLEIEETTIHTYFVSTKKGNKYMPFKAYDKDGSIIYLEIVEELIENSSLY